MYRNLLGGLAPWVILSILVFSSCKKDIRVEEPPVVTGFWDVNGSSKIDFKKTYDIIVYGGTPAGIMSAIEAKRSGKSVLLINHSEGALGGMLTNGLGNTDILHQKILGGLSKEFFKRIKMFYGNEESWFIKNIPKYGVDGKFIDIMIRFEPKAAQSVFKDLIMTEGIAVMHNDRLKQKNGVGRKNGKIEWIDMESGKRLKGKVFIDASYEGDLMAFTGVEYFVGRESNSRYGERFNGIRPMSNSSRFQIPDGVKSDYFSRFINNGIGSTGMEDHRVQAYCYRMCLTDIEENKVQIEKPIDYKEELYEVLFSYLENYKGIPFFDLNLMPNRKTDSNNSGPVSTDFVGENYKYPNGTYAERAEIRKKHRNYQVGLLWTLQNHPKVPEYIRQNTSKWGLAKDEFTDNGHWPKQLYIRESRRMISDYVMTENNCNGNINVDYSVGLGDYPMDSHIVQRFVDKNGNIKNEGHAMVGVPRPYGIDYRSIVPKQVECTNLIVPVCLSASHIAYGSIRMEPVFMSLGQAATCIAILAIDQKKPVQSINYTDLASLMAKREMAF